MRIRIAAGLLFTCALFAQESRTVLDNDQVKVLSVLVQPHQKTKAHRHAANRVMIYLQPGKQDLRYQDGKNVVLNWKAGDAKWSPAGGMHVAEITSGDPVRIIEIELKKPGHPDAAGPNALDPVKLDPKHYKVDLENDQVRVLRVNMGAHESTPMHVHALNRVVVYLTDQTIKVTSKDGKVETATHKAGDVSWGVPTEHREQNLGNLPFDLYAVELKN